MRTMSLRYSGMLRVQRRARIAAAARHDRARAIKTAIAKFTAYRAADLGLHCCSIFGSAMRASAYKISI